MKATNKSKEIIGYALSATSLLNGKKRFAEMQTAVHP